MFTIIGLQNGIVLQRDNTNHCDSWITITDAGDADVSSDIGVLTETESPPGKRRFHLTGICTGGPYTLTLTVGGKNVVYTDVYVGDVWILGGQSNMDGAGYYHKTLADYVPCEAIRFYSTDELWKVGEPRLHQNYKSRDESVRRKLGYPAEAWQDRGVGPGYAFAKAMRERTGVPQGLISCAVAGSGLFQWDPDAPREPEPNFYGIMLRKYAECGGNAKGMFWYQGCSETYPDGAEHFTDRMVHFVESFRRDLKRADMAFVQVQIYQYRCAAPEADGLWNRIREAQRTLHEHIDNMDTVAVTNAELADAIHLDSNTHAILGKNAAESMYRLCFDPYGRTSTLAPQLDSIRLHPLAVKYKNVNGRLISEGRATGYALSMSPDRWDRRHIVRVDLHGDTAWILHELPTEELHNAYLFYMFGNNAYANITDEDGRPIPAMGPIPLKEYLK
jgi:hypothetical protein